MSLPRNGAALNTSQFIIFHILVLTTTTTMPPHIIYARNFRAFQKSPGGIPPRLYLQMMLERGPEGVEVWERLRRERDRSVKRLVNGERSEALARGVQVIYEDTPREEYFSWTELPDVVPNSGN